MILVERHELQRMLLVSFGASVAARVGAGDTVGDDWADPWFAVPTKSWAGVRGGCVSLHG